MTRHKMGDEDIARMIDIIGDGELTVEAQNGCSDFGGDGPLRQLR